MNAYRLAFSLIAGLTVTLAQAAPSLIGDAVTVTYRAPEIGDVFLTDVVTVGANREISCPGAFAMCTGLALFDDEYLDIGALSIAGHFANPEPFPEAPFAGFAFEGLDFGGGEQVVGVSLITNIAGLTASNISFNGHTVFVNLANSPNPVGDFSISLTVAAVPEPATWALLAVALSAAGARDALRRRRAQR